MSYSTYHTNSSWIPKGKKPLQMFMDASEVVYMRVLRIPFIGTILFSKVLFKNGHVMYFGRSMTKVVATYVADQNNLSFTP